MTGVLRGQADRPWDRGTAGERVLDLRAGEVVEVRSIAEIMATLDGDGELDGLPFMPEMLRYSGERLAVSSRAHKACDRIETKGLRRMEHAVHLEAIRCDGSAHDGCQAGCLIYWKEAWLKRVPDTNQRAAPSRGIATNGNGHPEPHRGGSSEDAEAILRATTVSSPRETPPEERVYSCQATELNRATTPLKLEDPRQYWIDVRSGNVTLLRAIRGLLIGIFNRFQTLTKTHFPGLPRIWGGRRYPHIQGRLEKTPTVRLDLQPGEMVRVKSREEIVGTLDTRNRNRGLSFDVEMLRYCGTKARVLRRIDRIIDERTGRMVAIDSDCIVLEGVTCTGEYHQFCPRSIYPYWREIWLERL